MDPNVIRDAVREAVNSAGSTVRVHCDGTFKSYVDVPIDIVLEEVERVYCIIDTLAAELAQLRADAERWRKVVEMVRDVREENKWPISDAHFANTVGSKVLKYLENQGCGDPFYGK